MKAHPIESTPTMAVIDSVDGALVMVDAAYLALTQAVEFQQTRKISNLAVAAAAYAREAKDTRLLEAATELRTRAERKAGEMLTASAKDGTRAKIGGDRDSIVGDNDYRNKAPTLAQIGVTKDQSSKFQKLAQISDAVFEQVVAEAKARDHEVSTAKVLRAAEQQQPKTKTKPAATATTKPTTANVVVDTDVREVPAAKETKTGGEKPSLAQRVGYPGWREQAITAGLMRRKVGALEKRRIRDDISRRTGIPPEVLSAPKPTTKENSTLIAKAIGEMAAKVPAEKRYAEHRSEVASLPETTRERFERLVERELKLRNEMIDKEVQTLAGKMLDAALAEAVEKERKHYGDMARFHADEANALKRVRSGVKGLWDVEDYRFLLGATHPDREPDREKLTRAFHIVKKLQPYIDALMRPTEKSK